MGVGAIFFLLKTVFEVFSKSYTFPFHQNVSKTSTLYPGHGEASTSKCHTAGHYNEPQRHPIDGAFEQEEKSVSHVLSGRTI